MTALLEVEDLNVCYGQTPVLADVGLRIAEGEAVGVVGSSGSGKSTLAATVLGLLAPGGRVRSGAVRLRGEELLSAGPERLRRLRGAQIGYVMQDALRALNPTMPVGAQVAEAVTVHGGTPAEADARTTALFDAVGLTPDHRRAYPHQLSGGQRQRVAIAAAIANSPPLLIADEPTTGLDVVVQRRLLDLLADLRVQLGLSVLLISHDARVVARLCERTVTLEHGRLRAAPPPQRHGAQKRCGRAPGATAAVGRPLLELRGVSVTYRRRGRRAPLVAALRDVDLTVGAGEVVGLVGRSGSGKSTLALAAIGLVAPTAGEVILDGQQLHRLRGAARRTARASAHLIFQDAYDSIADGMSAARVLAEPAAIRRRPITSSELVTALAHAGLRPPEQFLGRRAAELSGGERQRLALARALASGGRLVIADEPTSMLDSDLRHELAGRMRAGTLQHGGGLLFITHDLELARWCCDRLVVLHEGRVVEQGSAEQLLSRPRAPETKLLLNAASL